ncbi:hypothetical protein HELRODRAFT_175830 [Helobdella robusta]|uniref:Uncharacterized protein n=1 Tax=Helobdella robusta TaxID=6412 RepID=T1F9Q5_HELRO|nr:hypothetical protein HELRODRAFT_175830 [Helobdella robusta]ESO00410.1 hypothetical protein HELRODRAFT_175830 [Helobdella robusta]
MSPTHQVKYAGFGYTPSVRLNPSIRPTNCLKQSPSSHASVVPLLPNETNLGFFFSSPELNGHKVTSDQLIVRLLNEKRKRMMTTSIDDLPNLDNINLVKRRKMEIEKDDDSPQTEPSSYLSASSFTSIELRRPPLKRSCHDDGEEESLNSIRKLKIVDVREVRGAASSIDKTLPTSSACSTDSQLQIPLLEQKQQASYQETCNISKSYMWNTTRNPAAVSHLSSRRYMERKLRDLTKDSISSNSILAASSSRSSCESSSQHGDDHDVTCSGVFGLQHSPVPTDDSSSTKGFLYSALMDEKSSPSKYACLLEKKHTFKREITSDLPKKREVCIFLISVSDAMEMSGESIFSFGKFFKYDMHKKFILHSLGQKLSIICFQLSNKLFYISLCNDLTYRFDVTSEDLKKDKNLSYERIHTLMRLKKTSVKKNASVKIEDISDVTSGSNASVPDVIKIVSSGSPESTFSNVTTKSTVAPSHFIHTSNSVIITIYFYDGNISKHFPKRDFKCFLDCFTKCVLKHFFKCFLEYYIKRVLKYFDKTCHCLSEFYNLLIVTCFSNLLE